MAYGELIPVNVVTGFLGSGKTTLLQRLLKLPELSDSAVLVNEFGEVGLDHHLLTSATTPTLLMENGCLCCAIRGDLSDALSDLFVRRERADLPPFKRVIIETSGLADPAPIAYTVMAEPVLQHHFRLGHIITIVDAINGEKQLDSHEESAKQVAAADRLLVTKTDLASNEVTDSLKQRLARLNLTAGIAEATTDSLDPVGLLAEDTQTNAGKTRDAHHWISASKASTTRLGGLPPDLTHRHTEDVVSFALLFDEPLDWTAFGVWLTMLLHRHGDRVLRIKGLLNVRGLDAPLLVNGVQHIVHPPAHLDTWPDEDHRSRLVFIAQGIDQQRLEASLRAFNSLVP